MTDKKTKREIFMVGTVVSNKADKTVSVSVERKFQHPVYKKIVKKRKKYMAHDEKNESNTGDVVRIKLIRPLSKKKRWLVVDVISKAPVKEV